MSVHHEQVASALEVLEIRSHRSYSWLGQAFERDEAAVAARRSAPGRPWLARTLHARLYGDFFLTGAPAPASGPRSLRFDPGRASATERLSAANAGAGAREPGWIVRGRDGREVVIARDGLELRARPDQLADLGGGTGAGAEVALVLPNERRGASQGFYTLLGDAGAPDPGRAVDRVYWHLRAAGGPPLVGAVSELLNRERVPFRMKTVNDPRALRRCDTAVLYTRREDREGVLGLADAIRRRVAHHMREAVPALTLRLGPGLAFAEDPGGGESFGASRCRLVTEALIASWQAGDHGLAARLRHVVDRFGRDGIDLARPYLGRDSGHRPAPRAAVDPG